MELYYQKERDKDFFEVCESIRKENNPNYISVENIVKQAIIRESQSFYLNTEIYARIINKVRCGCLSKIRNNIKRRLYFEIWERYIQIKRENPKFNSMDCARIISEQKSPQFYISERHAANLYYKLLKSNPK
ncbi:MAG: hypothetical protein FWD60_04735 [Candidatus Azobacteroides sp.]|nr:hypothetical protein [Candidatus Azobacteroides sp.]